MISCAKILSRWLVLEVKMSAKVRVLDRDGKPVSNASVTVLWLGGGHSKRQTDQSGVADLASSGGTAESIEVDGKKVEGTIYLSDGVTTVYKKY
jgi:hypothetical protein